MGSMQQGADVTSSVMWRREPSSVGRRRRRLPLEELTWIEALEKKCRVARLANKENQGRATPLLWARLILNVLFLIMCRESPHQFQICGFFLQLLKLSEPRTSFVTNFVS